MSAPDTPLRVAHIITTLDVGGAERLLRGVLGAYPEAAHMVVVCLAPPGPLAAEITDLGVPVHTLSLRRAHQLPRALVQLTRLLRAVRPQVVQTWMYHADLLGGTAARLAGIPTVVWGVHASDLPRSALPWTTRGVIRLNARLSSRIPTRIVCSSASTLRVHAQQGYPRERMAVIPNGVDPAPVDPETAAGLRATLGLPSEATLIARVGRYAPQKDYQTFVAAAGIVARDHPSAHFVLCGAGLTAENATLAAWIDETGVAERFHLLGLRRDVEAVHAAADLAVSSSAFGETTPLALLEAMAQGTPVVATDVGDCATIVGPTGRIVPPRSPVLLAEAISDLLSRDVDTRQALGEAARRRVSEHYHLEQAAAAYAGLYRELIRRDPSRGSAGP